MTDHFNEAERLLRAGRIDEASVHAMLSIAQRLPASGAIGASHIELADGALGLDPIATNQPTPPARFDIAVLPGDDVVAAVNNAPAGSTVRLPPGVTRGVWGLRPQAHVQLWGDGTTELRGTSVIPAQAWRPRANGVWEATVRFPLLPDYSNSTNTRDPFDPNVQPEMLFADDERLERVTDDPGPGQWALLLGAEGDHTVLCGESPRESIIELAHAAEHGVYDAIAGAAPGVLVAGLTVARYAVPLFRGAIGRHREDGAAMGLGWRLHAITVDQVSGSGIAVGSGARISNALVRRCDISGIRGQRPEHDPAPWTTTVVERTRVSACGAHGAPDNEAGGIHCERSSIIAEEVWLEGNHGIGWQAVGHADSSPCGLTESVVENNRADGVRDRDGGRSEGSHRYYTRNAIRFNGDAGRIMDQEAAGVVVVDSTGVQLLGNSIHSNVGHQLLIADDGRGPGLRRLSMQENHLAGTRPLVRLRRGRDSTGNPRAEISGGNNRFHAERGERIVVLPDGRHAAMDAWPLNSDQLVGTAMPTPDPCDVDLIVKRDYGARTP